MPQASLGSWFTIILQIPQVMALRLVSGGSGSLGVLEEPASLLLDILAASFRFDVPPGSIVFFEIDYRGREGSSANNLCRLYK